MHARLTTFTLGPGKRSTAEKLADDFVAVAKAHKGYVSISFFGDDTSGEHGSYSLWETKEDADAITVAGWGKLAEIAGTGVAKEPPITKVFEVYEPKA